MNQKQNKPAAPKGKWQETLLRGGLLLGISLTVAGTVLAADTAWQRAQQTGKKTTAAETEPDNPASASAAVVVSLPEGFVNVSAQKAAVIEAALAQAELLRLGYSYDEALAVLAAVMEIYPEEDALTEKYQAIRAEQAELVAFEGVVSHVFFHSLIVDTDRAFDGDSKEAGYNYWMTTISEFEAILDSMYERGYVLVSIHDIADVVVNEDGTTSFAAAKIMLPEGKTPFILSIDDVNYYTYMEGDGFADCLVVDEDGKVKCQYTTAGGEVMIGDYDVVPLLDSFIEAHPDFSYQGARGLIAETGYNGALGYHYRMKSDVTNTYELVDGYEGLMEQARVVADALKASGWEFAVHGWGHKHTNQIEYNTLVSDTELWLNEVGSIVGETDVYIYPYGEEVAADSEKFAYLQSKGFHYYCGVDSNPFLMITPDYIRSARRNLDGYSMNYRPERLADLFDVSAVMDAARPPFE